ncbi:MAG: hypothetical protein QW057_08140 [Candidatus Bathyarchaeia archaeon]
MDAVIKVGGSLLEETGGLKALCRTLDAESKRWRIAVVPGGGPFADEVRLHDRRLRVSAQTSHMMAILAMEQYGLLLSDLLENGAPARSLREAISSTRARRLPVILPYRLLSRPNPLEASWDVTSDTIAAYLAEQLKARRLVLITDVDGLFTEDPKMKPEAELIPRVGLDELSRFPTRTCVDRALASQLRRYPLDTWVINGLYPGRLSQLLRGEAPVSTRIIVA